jgi:hypothetical protein
MKKELEWLLIAAVVYYGLGVALWYYYSAQNVRFPAAYPSPWSYALTWPVHVSQS